MATARAQPPLMSSPGPARPPSTVRRSSSQLSRQMQQVCYMASYSLRMCSRVAGARVTGQQCCEVTCLKRQG